MATQTVEQLLLGGEPRLEGDWPDLDLKKRELTRELAAFIHGNGIADWTDLHALLDGIQPPATVARLAAEAAIAVLIGFERGYRMADPEPEPGPLSPWQQLKADERDIQNSVNREPEA